jgi:hypothetical protein
MLKPFSRVVAMPLPRTEPGDMKCGPKAIQLLLLLLFPNNPHQLIMEAVGEAVGEAEVTVIHRMVQIMRGTQVHPISTVALMATHQAWKIIRTGAEPWQRGGFDVSESKAETTDSNGA